MIQKNDKVKGPANTSCPMCCAALFNTRGGATGNKAAVNRLDDQSGSKVAARTASATPDAPEVADSSGGPWRTRTSDSPIKRRAGVPSLPVPNHQKSALCAA